MVTKTNNRMNDDFPAAATDIRVDPVDNKGGFIRRKHSTVADLHLFVDPAAADGGDGSMNSPFNKVDDAMSLIPENIFHAVRVYLLDGNYTGQSIRVYNHYVSPRRGANGGIKIWGHVHSYDGETHPIYTDDKPENVVFDATDIVISGIYGTDQFNMLGIKFNNSWVQPFDCRIRLEKCLFSGGYDVPTYRPKIAIAGHWFQMVATNCTFDDVASVIDAEGEVSAMFDTCTVTNMVDSPAFPSKYGMPVYANNRSVVTIKNSPTFLTGGYTGKRNFCANDGQVMTTPYSGAASNRNYINRAWADETLELQGGDGVAIDGERGAGISLAGRNHPTLAGYHRASFGPSPSALYQLQFRGVGGTVVDCLTAYSDGIVKAHSAFIFGEEDGSLGTNLEDNQGAIRVDGSGNIFVYSKSGGTSKALKIFDFATGKIPAASVGS